MKNTFTSSLSYWVWYKSKTWCSILGCELSIQQFSDDYTVGNPMSTTEVYKKWMIDWGTEFASLYWRQQQLTLSNKWGRESQYKTFKLQWDSNPWPPSLILVQHSNQLSYEATNWDSKSVFSGSHHIYLPNVILCSTNSVSIIFITTSN